PPLICLFSPAPPTPPIDTLSLHDALPIFAADGVLHLDHLGTPVGQGRSGRGHEAVLGHLQDADSLQYVEHGRPLSQVDGRRQASDRKSTRLNFSHVKISYAVFCLKKKKAK